MKFLLIFHFSSNLFITKNFCLKRMNNFSFNIFPNQKNCCHSWWQQQSQKEKKIHKKHIKARQKGKRQIKQNKANKYQEKIIKYLHSEKFPEKMIKYSKIFRNIHKRWNHSFETNIIGNAWIWGDKRAIAMGYFVFPTIWVSWWLVFTFSHQIAPTNMNQLAPPTTRSQEKY